MDHTNEIVVPPSLTRLLFSLLIGGTGMIVGLFLIFGSGPTPTAVATAVGSLTVLSWIVGVLRQRPRLVVRSDGFTMYGLIGEHSQKWEDVEGQFDMIPVGRDYAVAWNITPEAKGRPGTKRRRPIGNYDAALGGALALSSEQIAKLLNDRLKERQNAASVPTT